MKITQVIVNLLIHRFQGKICILFRLQLPNQVVPFNLLMNDGKLCLIDCQYFMFVLFLFLLTNACLQRLTILVVLFDINSTETNIQFLKYIWLLLYICPTLYF